MKSYLKRGGVLRRCLGGGENRLPPPIGRRGSKTGAAVTSCPSIWPPSMCFIAASASSGFAYSMYAKLRPVVGCKRSIGYSTDFISPYALKISIIWSFVTFRVNRPM